MAIIHFDGFYYSGSIAWEDWHAGVRMHGERVHFRRYYPNRIWLGAYRDHTFDFWADSEQLDSNAIGSNVICSNYQARLGQMTNLTLPNLPI